MRNQHVLCSQPIVAARWGTAAGHGRGVAKTSSRTSEIYALCGTGQFKVDIARSPDITRVVRVKLV